MLLEELKILVAPQKIYFIYFTTSFYKTPNINKFILAFNILNTTQQPHIANRSVTHHSNPINKPPTQPLTLPQPKPTPHIQHDPTTQTHTSTKTTDPKNPTRQTRNSPQTLWHGNCAWFDLGLGSTMSGGRKIGQSWAREMEEWGMLSESGGREKKIKGDRVRLCFWIEESEWNWKRKKKEKKEKKENKKERKRKFFLMRGQIK